MEVNNMKDIEMLRIEKLIEEREAYENEFFSIEQKDTEFDFIISQFSSQLMISVLVLSESQISTGVSIH